jgi:plasmid replication initiation protein
VKVRYVDAEATVKLIFAPIVIPLITRLEERFTQYEMNRSEPTGYAIRLYELLICWRTRENTNY